MGEFKSWRSYKIFEYSTKSSFRYIHTQETLDFLKTVFETSSRRIETITAPNVLCRAQLGHASRSIIQDGEHIYDMPIPHPPERMKPLINRSVEGRANSKGISYLYLATHPDLALSEVRPTESSFITLTGFKILRDLNLINCTMHNVGSGNTLYMKEPSVEEREELVWRDIDTAFTMPVDPSDEVADYVPTQIIAELFRLKGFDGIAYHSSRSSGHNIVLFDPEAVEFMYSSLYTVDSVKYKFNKENI